VTNGVRSCTGLKKNGGLRRSGSSGQGKKKGGDASLEEMMTEMREFREEMKAGFKEMNALMDTSLENREAGIEIGQEQMGTEIKTGLKEKKAIKP
jgi:hypothetical protein